MLALSPCLCLCLCLSLSLSLSLCLSLSKNHFFFFFLFFGESINLYAVARNEREILCTFCTISFNVFYLAKPQHNIQISTLALTQSRYRSFPSTSGSFRLDFAIQVYLHLSNTPPTVNLFSIAVMLSFQKCYINRRAACDLRDWLSSLSVSRLCCAAVVHSSTTECVDVRASTTLKDVCVCAASSLGLL